MTYNVVFVDDAAELRMLIELSFKRDGRLNVVTAVGDGQQGIDAVREHHPDVVIMDISMPIMDGLTATRKLKQAFPNLPILILTGYGDARLEEEAAKAGADAFLDKGQPLTAIADAALALAMGTNRSQSRSTPD